MIGFLFNLMVFMTLGFIAYAFYIQRTMNSFSPGLQISFREALELAAKDMLELKDYVIALVTRKT